MRATFSGVQRYCRTLDSTERLLQFLQHPSKSKTNPWYNGLWLISTIDLANGLQTIINHYDDLWLNNAQHLRSDHSFSCWMMRLKEMSHHVPSTKDQWPNPSGTYVYWLGWPSVQLCHQDETPTAPTPTSHLRSSEIWAMKPYWSTIEIGQSMSAHISFIVLNPRQIHITQPHASLSMHPSSAFYCAIGWDA